VLKRQDAAGGLAPRHAAVPVPLQTAVSFVAVKML